MTDGPPSAAGRSLAEADEDFAARWVAIAPDDGRARARLLAEAVLSLPPDAQPAARRHLLSLGVSRDCPELLGRTLRALAARQLVRAYRLASLLDDGLLLARAARGRLAVPLAPPAGDEASRQTGDSDAG